MIGPNTIEGDLATVRHKRDDDAAAADAAGQGLSVGEVLRSPEPGIRKPLWTLVAVMLFQQLS